MPTVIRSSLTDGSLFFLGFHLDDWKFRVLFRMILSIPGSFNLTRYYHVGVQVEPDESTISNARRVREYLESYFRKPNPLDPIALTDHFEIWGPTRVARLPPADLNVTNRYTWSALDGFEQILRQDKEKGLQDSRILRIPGSLASMSIEDYISERKDKKNALLIFDQFEEILRVDADGVEAKRAFFDQLGAVFFDPRIWALFVLREDYLAPFDP